MLTWKDLGAAVEAASSSQVFFSLLVLFGSCVRGVAWQVKCYLITADVQLGSETAYEPLLNLIL